MSRTRTTRPRRRNVVRAAIAAEITKLGPTVKDEMQRAALEQLAAWCVIRGRKGGYGLYRRCRPGPAGLACFLLIMIRESASLDRKLDAAIRACILAHRGRGDL
jgi:hypothetical protein